MALPLFQAGKTIFISTNPVIEGPYFNSEQPLLKVQQATPGSVTGASGSVTFPHKLSYTPQFLLFIERVSGSRMRQVNNNYDTFGTWVSKATGDNLDAYAYADATNVYLNWNASVSATYKYFLYVYYDPATDLL